MGVLINAILKHVFIMLKFLLIVVIWVMLTACCLIELLSLAEHGAL